MRSWISFEEYAEQIRTHFHKQILFVQFEELVSDPTKSMNKVWSFLDLSPPEKLHRSVLKNVIDPEPVSEIYRTVATEWKRKIHLPTKFGVQLMARRYLFD